MGTLHHIRGGAPALPLALIEQAIPRLSRHDLEALTERLIGHLDEIDGDADTEDDTVDCCSAADDGCAPIWRHGVLRWGSEHEDQGV